MSKVKVLENINASSYRKSLKKMGAIRTKTDKSGSIADEDASKFEYFKMPDGKYHVIWTDNEDNYKKATILIGRLADIKEEYGEDDNDGI